MMPAQMMETFRHIEPSRVTYAQPPRHYGMGFCDASIFNPSPNMSSIVDEIIQNTIMNEMRKPVKLTFKPMTPEDVDKLMNALRDEEEPEMRMPAIDQVIFNNPATIVKWSDGTKTVVKCQKNDVYSKEVGLAMCICKKVYGNDNTFNKVMTPYLKDEE